MTTATRTPSTALVKFGTPIRITDGPLEAGEFFDQRVHEGDTGTYWQPCSWPIGSTGDWHWVLVRQGRKTVQVLALRHQFELSDTGGPNQ